MSTRPMVRNISPMLAVESMEESIAFYWSVLGFEATLNAPEYAVLERDGRSIHLMPAASAEVTAIVRAHTEIYIEVRGIRELYAHVKTFKDRYKMTDLIERDYGMTEFHINDGNCLIFVGELTTNIR